MPGLKVESLTKNYGGKTVVNRVSFDVAQGQFCILLGPSGCGKTTILRMIAGLVPQEEGRILIGGRDVGGLEPKDRDIAMVFQSYALYPHLNVYDNMAFPLAVRKTPRRETDARVRQAAALLEIEQLLDRKPAQLSGGQRQRVAIGRALVRRPSLFLFDEPLSNLDAQLRSSMRLELARLHRSIGGTIVYVTHDQTEAMTLGQKIIVFDKGIIQQEGSPQDIYDRPANLFVASFIGSPPINILAGLVATGGVAVVCAAAGVEFAAEGRSELARCAGAEIRIGIRPEALRPGDGPIRAVVELVENLGADHILHLRAGSAMLVAKLPASGTGPRAGETLSLQVSPAELLFFHQGKLLQ
ncbi:MAG: ABC transporter ATP-binding protein [Deltaproteobacteria bacterium]|nr:ABC transporter ATP-binding protein [Deltaproteobacteria bacterium]